MKKVILKQYGVEVGQAVVADDKVQEMSAIYLSNYKGQPEQWVEDNGNTFVAKILDTRDVIVSPAVDAVMNDAGEIVQEAIPAVVIKEVKLEAEYTVEVVDVTKEYALIECLSKRKAEYPTPEEFLDVYFDLGEAGLQTLRAKRLQIKQKYPKP